MFIFRIMIIRSDLSRVVAVQPFAGSEPHKTAGVLNDSIYGTLRQPILDGEVLKTIVARLCIRA